MKTKDYIFKLFGEIHFKTNILQINQLNLIHFVFFFTGVKDDFLK